MPAKHFTLLSPSNEFAVALAWELSSSPAADGMVPDEEKGHATEMLTKIQNKLAAVADMQAKDCQCLDCNLLSMRMQNKVTTHATPDQEYLHGVLPKDAPFIAVLDSMRVAGLAHLLTCQSFAFCQVLLHNLAPLANLMQDSCHDRSSTCMACVPPVDLRVMRLTKCGVDELPNDGRE
eukprot:2576188-Amphidinium_carterae.1